MPRRGAKEFGFGGLLSRNLREAEAMPDGGEAIPLRSTEDVT